MRHFLLTGFKGCGKSTIGWRLAKKTGRAFVDLDNALEDLYARDGERLRFREIYAEVGPEEFRRLEAEAARIAAKRAEKVSEGLVLGLGGGTLHNPEARSAVRGMGYIVYLKAPIDELVRRAHRTGFPAYVDPEDPEPAFRERFLAREPGYLEFSDQVVDLGLLGHWEAVKKILEETQGKV